MEVDGVTELRKVLGTRSGAAPEGILRRAVCAPVPGGQREEVLLQTRSVLCTQPGVEQRALIRIHPARVTGPREQVPLQLHQVVGNTAFCIVQRQGAGQRSGRRLPVLVITGVADGIGAGSEDIVEEVAGDIAVPRVCCCLIHAGRADDLRDACVGMQALQFVAVHGKRVQERGLLELAGDGKIALFAGEAVEVDQHLVHAAVLHAKDALTLLVAHVGKIGGHPSRHAFRYFESFFIAGLDVHIHQPGHDLVAGIERCPDILSKCQPLEQIGRIRTEVAVAVGLLAGGQAGHQRIALVAEHGVPSSGRGKCDRGKIVPAGEVAAQLSVRYLPPAVWLCRGRDAGSQAEAVQQTIHLQAVQVALIHIGRTLEVSIEQPNRGHRKRRKPSANL